VIAKKTRIGKSGSLELRVWLRLLSCTNIVLRNLRRNLKDTYSVSMPRFDLLAQVARPRTGPSLTELSRRLLVTKGNITDIVARLEAENLVERHSDDTDGRIQYVFLTQAGQDLLSQILPAHDSWLRELMRGMSRKDLRTLYGALGILTSALKGSEQRKTGVANAVGSEDEDNKNGDLAKASHRAATRVVRR
jgi:DNA-binding MarR family transcriptional regulator